MLTRLSFRVCIGLELAKQEITLMTGNMLQRFDLELFQTTAIDVNIYHDYFAPWAAEGSNGVRLLAK